MFNSVVAGTVVTDPFTGPIYIDRYTQIQFCEFFGQPYGKTC